MNWILRHKWMVLVTIVIVGGAGWYVRNRQSNQGPFYETIPVERGDVVRTVDVTGQVKPEARIGLSFPTIGKVVRIKVKVGDRVNAGDAVMELDAQDASFSVQRSSASLSAARANLQARLAGETSESIQIAEASVQQAQAAYEKSVSDLAATRLGVEEDYRVAAIAVDTADRNRTNSAASTNQTVQNAYDNGRYAIVSALGSMQTSLVDGDAIIGIDNASANDAFEDVLGVADRFALQRARSNYLLAKAAHASAVSASQSLLPTSTSDEIRQAADKVRTALQSAQMYLDDVQRVLAGTITTVNFTATQLATKQGTIDSDRTAVSTQISTVATAMQTISNAEIARTTTNAQMENAYATALANLAIADTNRTSKVRAAEATVAVQKAAVQSAQASLAAKKAPPRAVDVAALRAQVQDATTAYEQAVDHLNDMTLRAPTEGVIADIVPESGEQVSANVAVVHMVATDGYTVEALVPEADISKVEPGQSVTMTLDAYGYDVEFQGRVVSEEPDQTVVQDAIYYTVYIELDAQGKDVKPGMTVNATILTGKREGVMVIPSRAIREGSAGKYVQRMDGSALVDMLVELGMRGDEGRVEVLSGVEEGQSIVVGELTAAEYRQQQGD